MAKWEYGFFPVEFSDPYWDQGQPLTMLRSGSKGGPWLNELGAEGWELVTVVPVKPVAGMPAALQQVTPDRPQLKWNLYYGIFKRSK